VPEAAAKNVVEALSRVMRDMPGIGKDSNAAPQQGGYAYRGIEAITREAQPLLAKHGVVFVPNVLSCEVKDIVVQNKPWTDTTLLVRWDIYGPGGPEDLIVAQTVGIGRDNSDKGANKAMTQSLKYALLDTLMVADAKDDADGQTHAADAAPAPPDGWEDADECAKAHAELARRIKALGDKDREWCQAYRQSNGWPMDAEHFGELELSVADFEKGEA
jgi:ERF superfamily